MCVGFTSLCLLADTGGVLVLFTQLVLTLLALSQTDKRSSLFAAVTVMQQHVVSVGRLSQWASTWYELNQVVWLSCLWVEPQ